MATSNGTNRLPAGRGSEGPYIDPRELDGDDGIMPTAPHPTSTVADVTGVRPEVLSGRLAGVFSSLGILANPADVARTHLPFVSASHIPGAMMGVDLLTGALCLMTGFAAAAFATTIAVAYYLKPTDKLEADDKAGRLADRQPNNTMRKPAEFSSGGSNSLVRWTDEDKTESHLPAPSQRNRLPVKAKKPVYRIRHIYGPWSERRMDEALRMGNVPIRIALDPNEQYDEHTGIITTAKGRVHVTMTDLLDTLALFDEGALGRLVKDAGLVRWFENLNPSEYEDKTDFLSQLGSALRTAPEFTVKVIDAAAQIARKTRGRDLEAQILALKRDRKFGASVSGETGSLSLVSTGNYRYDRSISEFFLDHDEGSVLILTNGQVIPLESGRTLSDRGLREVVFEIVLEANGRYYLYWPDTQETVPVFYIDRENRPHDFGPERVDKEGRFTELFPGQAYQIGGVRFWLPNVGTFYDRRQTDHRADAPDEDWSTAGEAVDLDTRILIHYLTVLGLEGTTQPTIKELKKAYKKMAREFHPDLHQDATESELGELAEQFKVVDGAYRALMKHFRYVTGTTGTLLMVLALLMADDEAMAATADRAPSDINQYEQTVPNNELFQKNPAIEPATRKENDPKAAFEGGVMGISNFSAVIAGGYALDADLAVQELPVEDFSTAPFFNIVGAAASVESRAPLFTIVGAMGNDLSPQIDPAKNNPEYNPTVPRLFGMPAGNFLMRSPASLAMKVIR